MSMNCSSMANGIRRSLLDDESPRLPQINIDDSEEHRSVPSADCSYELYIDAPFFTESYLTDSRSLFIEEPRNYIGSNIPADTFNDQASTSHEYADSVNVGTNAWDGRSFNVPGHAFYGACQAAGRTVVLQQSIPLVKRRKWNDPPTPPLDSWLPEVLQEEEAAAANEHQHELEYMEVHEYRSLSEDGFYPNVDTQQAEGNHASRYLLLASVQYASYRIVKFQVHDGYLTGKINIAGFQHRQIYVWNNESLMEFSVEIFANNDTGEIQFCNIGIIEFPYMIQRETFACWYDPYQPFLCFRAIYL